MIYFSDFAAGGGGGGTPPSVTDGALVTVSADIAIGANAAITWNTETYDDDGFHDAGSNTDRLTVPTGVTLVRLLGNASSASSSLYYMQKGGSSFAGRGSGQSDTAGSDSVSLSSGILAVSSTNYFTLHTTGAVTITAPAFGGVAANSWFGIETFDAAQQYCLLAKSSGQAISAATDTAITWDTETADTDGFHTGSSSQIVIPSGVSCVRLSANMKYTSGSGSGAARLTIFKNGAAFDGMGFCEQSGTVVKTLVCHTAPIDVSPGDIFEAFVLAAAAGTVNNVDETWFGIEVINPSTKRAVVRKSATANTASGSFGTVVYDTDIVDTAAIHDTSSDTSRLTVPSGVTQARVSYNLRAAASGQIVGRVIKGGAATTAVVGVPVADSEVSGSDAVGGLGQWLPVSAGEYFEFQAFGTTAAAIDITCTWFAMECR